MIQFDPGWFPRYRDLSAIERLFIRTCCYLPPRPHRQASPETLKPIADCRRTYENAFGTDLWSLVRDRTVLDAGCGEGSYALALAASGSRYVVGVDILNRFHHARDAGNTHGYRNLAFVNGPIHAFTAGAFDVVISHDSFEHLEDPDTALADMVRITRPGGHILIKFGPAWCSPWGRHMSGTIRRDRPWVHLLVPEKIVMRCHSVYHNEPTLLEKYAQLRGGLNKMTVRLFARILKCQRGIVVESIEVLPLHGLKGLSRIPFANELIASGVRAHCVRIAS